MSRNISAHTLRVALPLLLITAVTLALPEWAQAHRVNIFAWVEGNVIHTESTFSSGNKAQNSLVTATVKDNAAPIAEGRTDTDGMWSFTLSPQIIAAHPDILISLSAGEGHANTWTISGAEYAAEASATGGAATAPATSSESDTGDMPPFMEETAPASPHTTQAAPGSPEMAAIVEHAVEQALERKLAPIRRQLAESTQHAPTVQDIMGGLGYIFGLFGVAAYMQSRKRK